jgi:Asp-tRNA(Asn)/Glu-tRNA(Gln) amidotransferase C subunit
MATKSLTPYIRGYSFRGLSTSPALWQRSKTEDESQLNVEKLLAKPTWSVASLLPPKDLRPDQSSVSSTQLRHLLKLSALPPPKDDKEESRMLETLTAQLHFVKEIQQVDTDGVEPFRGLRDETAKGEHKAELGLTAMQDALAREEIRGKHHRRIRRKNDDKNGDFEEWDVLATAENKAGRLFVVEGGVPKRAES